MATSHESTGNSGHQGHSRVTEQVREKAGEAAAKLQDIGAKTADAAREQYGHLRDTASEYFHDSQERARAWRAHLEEYVQEKPMRSLLIAAGVGMLFGFIWRRR